MAPDAARIPQVMCAPSKAGPEAQETLRISPRDSRQTSVLVPISRASTLPVACQRRVPRIIAM